MNSSGSGGWAVGMPSDGVVALRAWTRGDAAFLSEAAADPEIRRYNGPHDRDGRPAPPPTVAQAEKTIEGFEQGLRAFESTGRPAGVVFAITDARSAELVGCCGVDEWTDEDVARFGYWIGPGHRGRGYATRAAVLLTGWLFERGAARVALTVVAGNDGSVAVARRAGFVHEGTMRAYGVWQGERCDVLVFAALAGEWAAPSLG
jgi:RimJ/RimL family protein N-acetyltransferase